jgi:hypothetical protein
MTPSPPEPVTSAPPTPVVGPSGPGFWIGAALGTAITAFGVYGLLHNLQGIALTSWLKTFAGALVLHDAIFAPLVLAASVVLVRVLPRRARAPVQVACIASGALIAISIPVVRGTGRLANNLSLLPSHAYGTRLLVVLGVIWLIAAAASAVRIRRPAT